MVDAICSMLCDYYCKYSPFVFPLFVGARVGVDEGPKFTTRPTNGGYESIEIDVRADGGTNLGIKFEVDGVTGLLVPSMRLCQCFKTLCMACPYIDFKRTNISSFCKTTLSDPSSFDVHVFNSYNVSRNLSFKVSS
jgi:hypothetical protein